MQGNLILGWKMHEEKEDAVMLGSIKKHLVVVQGTQIQAQVSGLWIPTEATQVESCFFEGLPAWNMSHM